MNQTINGQISPSRAAVFAGVAGVVLVFGACASEPGGISDSDDSGGTDQGGTGGASATGGSGQSGSGGAPDDETGGSGAVGEGGETSGQGGTANGGTSGQGTGGEAAGGVGGVEDPTGGSTGDGEGGMGGSDDGTLESCVFHSAPMGGAAQGGMGGAGGGAGSGSIAGAGGSAGAAGASADVTIRTSPFLGSYLADAAGRTLYFYGSDLTGDCENLPVSRCTADCLVAWPVYNAGARALAPGLDDAAFGTIQLSDGSFQTTYYGWPLYYYKDDTAPGLITGQGKGKTWHVAEVKLPNVVIMREGSIRYLADTAGRTLYMSSADQVGSDAQDPESHCDASCLTAFERVRAPNLSVVQSLEQDHFWTFLNPDGSLQLGYKGAPLYRARTDQKAGDMTGTATTGFSAALP